MRIGVTSLLKRSGLWALLAVAGLLAVLVPAASLSAQTPPPLAHGIGFAKGCAPTANVGDPYSCFYLLINDPNLNTAHDTLNVTALTDVVHAFAGPVLSPGTTPLPP